MTYLTIFFQCLRVSGLLTQSLLNKLEQNDYPQSLSTITQRIALSYAIFLKHFFPDFDASPIPCLELKEQTLHKMIKHVKPDEISQVIKVFEQRYPLLDTVFANQVVNAILGCPDPVNMAQMLISFKLDGLLDRADAQENIDAVCNASHPHIMQQLLTTLGEFDLLTPQNRRRLVTHPNLEKLADASGFIHRWSTPAITQAAFEAIISTPHPIPEIYGLMIELEFRKTLQPGTGDLFLKNLAQKEEPRKYTDQCIAIFSPAPSCIAPLLPFSHRLGYGLFSPPLSPIHSTSDAYSNFPSDEEVISCASSRHY